MAFTTNNGVRLHWQEQGEGTPVLLIMGHRYSSALWYPMLPALTARHRVIWFDNRGTGQSDTSRRVTIADFVDDAIAVLDAAGVDRAHVFGVSMGGGIALEMGIRRPDRVRSLLLGCTCMLTAEKPRMPAFVRALYYLPPWLLKLLMRNRRGDHGYGVAAPAEAVAFDQEMLKTDPFTVPGVVAQAAAVAGYCTTAEAVAGVTLPALVLHGDEDAVVPFAWGEELARTLPNSRFVRLEGAGHNFIVARREASVEAVMDFIAETDRA